MCIRKIKVESNGNNETFEKSLKDRKLISIEILLIGKTVNYKKLD